MGRYRDLQRAQTRTWYADRAEGRPRPKRKRAPPTRTDKPVHLPQRCYYTLDAPAVYAALGASERTPEALLGATLAGIRGTPKLVHLYPLAQLVCSALRCPEHTRALWTLLRAHFTEK